LPADVCAWLMRANPWVVTKAYTAIRGILSIRSDLKAFLMPGNQDICAVKVQEMVTKLDEHSSTLAQAIMSLDGRCGVGNFFKQYKVEREKTQVVQRCEVVSGSNVPRLVGHWLYPYLAECLFGSAPAYRSRVLQDHRTAARVITAPIVITKKPGTFTDFESLMSQNSFWSNMRARGPTFALLADKHRAYMYSIIDTPYHDDVEKGNNGSLWTAVLRNPSSASGPSSAQRERVRPLLPIAGLPPASADAAPLAPVECAAPTCEAKFVPSKSGARFCPKCFESWKKTSKAEKRGPPSGGRGGGPDSAKKVRKG
jgi:hypothetical protein